MSKRNLFEELKQGIEEMHQHDRGEIELATHTYPDPDVQAIREHSGLSQSRHHVRAIA